jgi:hypothetical protein
MSYDHVRKEIEEAGASMRCNELISLLESLGFTVEGKAGHKKFKHASLPLFYGSNFNCGHGTNPQIKRCYIKSIGKTLDEFEDEIKEYMKTR